MDLIDRRKIDFYKLTGPELVSAMEEAPSVPAVPLDKLCEWLEDNASLRHGTSVSRHSWKQMIASDLIGEKNEDHA